MAEITDAGMSRSEAEQAVLERMGDPEEVGKALNAAHRPLLGWLWMASKWLVIVCVVAVMGLFLTAPGRLGIDLEDLPTVEFSDGARVWDSWDYAAGYLFAVNHAAVWENESGSDGEGRAMLALTVWDVLGSGHVSSSCFWEICAVDDRGNRYSAYRDVADLSEPDRPGYVGAERRGSRVVSEVYVVSVNGVPLDVQWVELWFGEGERAVRLRVQLPGGEGK